MIQFNFVRTISTVLTSETGFIQRFLAGEAGFASQFLASETGFVNQRAGLPIAWTVGVLVVASALLGTPETVRANQHYCGSLSGCNNCTSRCINAYNCPDAYCWAGVCACYCGD